MSLGRKIASLVVSSAIALAVAAAGSTSAFAESAPVPGSYAYYSFDRAPAEGLSDVEFGIKVTTDPGKSANVFWSNQFRFTSGKVAYAGMQSNGAGNKRTFLFSVWDATETKVGSAGSWCQSFGGEGTGMSCRINVEWVEGHEYKFNLAHEGDKWFGVNVVNTTTGASFKLGSIRTESERIKPTEMVSWVEYYESNSPKATCLDQPYSRAEIRLPRANTGTLTAGVLGTSTKPLCPGSSTVEVNATTTVHTNAIGNSTRGPITGLNGLVLDGGPGTGVAPLTIQPNTSGTNTNQNWVLAKDGSIRLGQTTGLCLDTGGTTAGTKAISYPCHNRGGNQEWKSINATLVNPRSGLCLDVSWTTNEVLTYYCHGGPNQQWGLPQAR